jgi:hypothetical protein
MGEQCGNNAQRVMARVELKARRAGLFLNLRGIWQTGTIPHEKEILQRIDAKQITSLQPCNDPAASPCFWCAACPPEFLFAANQKS